MEFRAAETGQADASGVSPADRKRLKHREYVKRSYNKKITTIASLRRELETLEHEYQAMLRPSAASPAHAESPQLRQYLIATEIKTRQQEENERLYQLNAEHMKVESRLNQLLDCSNAPPQPPQPQLQCFQIQPLSVAAYEQVIAETTADVMSFQRNNHKLSTGARVLGWTDQREVRGASLTISLQKDFANVSPRELSRRSWAIFTSPKQYSQIYGSALDTDIHVLQTVDADTLLLYRRITPRPSRGHVVKTIFLMTRRPVSQGYLLLFRSVDRELLRFQELDKGGVPHVPDAELWTDMHIWVLLTERPERPDHCRFHFGGATTTSLWLHEVLFIALRWENLAVGPQFCLTAD